MFTNKADSNLTGYTAEELKNMSVTDIISSNDKEDTLKRFKEQISYGHWASEIEMRKKNGQLITVDLNAVVFPNGLIYGSYRDISWRKYAENELIRCEEEYRQLFDQSLTGNFISTVDGKLIKCNSAYLRILGFESMEEVNRYDLTRLYPDPETRKYILNTVRRNTKLLNYEYEMTRKDGTRIYLIGNVLGKYNEQRVLVGLWGYMFDDTHRKNILKKLRKLTRAVEHSPVSIVVTNIAGDIEYVNPKFSELTGYSAEEVTGKNPRILKSGHTTLEEYKKMWDSLIAGNEWKGEFLNKKKGGELYWESASISPMISPAGEIKNFVAVKEDITERKRMEEDLRIALEKAQESDRLKSAFLNTMSHELRTPLNAVIGFSELILGDASPDDIKKFSRIINTSGYNLLEIVEGIFDIALIDSGLAQMKKSEFSVNKLIREIYTTAIVSQEQTGKTQITIVGKPEPDQKDILLYTDHGKLRQILNHLLKNAVKFTEAGLIEFGYAGGMDEGNPVITFYVRDTGIGISGKSQEIIFDLFRQEDNSHTRKYRGTGIGLSVVKRLIQLLGGRIWVESEPGKGSAFFFTLPADQMDREPTPVKTTGIISAGMKFSGKTILIAEDEESNFELLGAMMAGMAIRLVWARNGKEAVLMSLSDPSVELVLMDIRMPIMNGYEATRMIKKVRPGLPVVAQTANALSRDRGEAISAGCDDYIEKPIRKRDLLNVLVKYLSA